MKAWAIIAAAGVGTRMGADRPKQYLEIDGRPIICHTLERFKEAPCIESVVVVVEPGREEAFKHEILKSFGFPKSWIVVAGGKVRQESVANGLVHIPSDCDVVVVHDGVRPFVRASLIQRSAQEALCQGACIAATPIKETIKRVVKENIIAETVDRQDLWNAKTPQAFRLDLLTKAMEKATEDGFIGTDEASIVERLGVTVKILESDDRNIKITTPSDLIVAQSIFDEWESTLSVDPEPVEGS
ncbi:MAG: 2-C-methyl-D-erythritol 4-phosphate cytidylyltransferase [Pseudomonadota bacterium]